MIFPITFKCALPHTRVILCSILLLKLHLGRLFPGRMALSTSNANVDPGDRYWRIAARRTSTAGQMEGGGLEAAGQSLIPGPALELGSPEEGGRHLPWQSRCRAGLQKSLRHCHSPGNGRTVTEHISFGSLFCAYLREYRGNKKV